MSNGYIAPLQELKWLTNEQVRALGSSLPTPFFVYSEAELRQRIAEVKNFPVNEGEGFGLTARYAMKANPSLAVLKIMKEEGIQIDASSQWEVKRALRAGFTPQQIQWTAQELSTFLPDFIQQGVLFNACSLHQLENYGKHFPGSKISIRFNPGTGSGECLKRNVGGAHSSFGVWHTHIDQVKEVIEKYKLIVYGVHSHIGSGSDPEVWKEAAKVTLEMVKHFPDCVKVNLGGGYKVVRMQGEGEKPTEIQAVGLAVKELFYEFYKEFNRPLHLEVEPGSYYMTNSGSLIASINDVVNTGDEGFKFIKLNTGMDSLTRPALYGARHAIIVVPEKEDEQRQKQIEDIVIVGHCCETGDLFTQDPVGKIEKRRVVSPHIGDYVVLEGSGAYCSSMCTKNYNSFPELSEIMVMKDSKFRLVRKQQTLEQICQNECDELIE
uniref:Diaminopimelate decarboxylase n=1 Tax=Paramoeba aestuarina TaxID=180227 RepID=A0A7S4JN85_9EUKA|eukprot:CAMPEP_0201528274 /NCGR_PEP_ID=MMETSP0161_2-20130828/37820_1 /ASSEMBLY_ACC=CAM_ASM_000251 /TAXON_ID=180227 /ORGANISM="Neoparamoeba aestuarina, Strain SoJaBio B1-5/56/2" /LENGTH=436 /DNA_ID=CAMNT_0047929477 /DNA_START=118 /DNA_END=1428 /DNA_ORIENTATION=+